MAGRRPRAVARTRRFARPGGPGTDRSKALTNRPRSVSAYGSAAGTGTLAALLLVGVCGSPLYVGWVQDHTDPDGAGGWFLRLLAWPAWRVHSDDPAQGVLAADLRAILLVILAAALLYLLPAAQSARVPARARSSAPAGRRTPWPVGSPACWPPSSARAGRSSPPSRAPAPGSATASSPAGSSAWPAWAGAPEWRLAGLSGAWRA